MVAALIAGLTASTAIAAMPKDQLIMGWHIDAISSFDQAEINEIVPMQMLGSTSQLFLRTDGVLTVPSNATSSP
ncbi:hypothetical protein [Sinorhizobium meliloti]|uniref:hypothetical protein n=1 Tax=Rhizobium meliloti TaxID=382 RepID=UPI002090B0CC|nr:hypothetical protein [Sinorhizobium meliloti]MCO5965419.1 hypothetical protein [Sinorhizobium meliloti]